MKHFLSESAIWKTSSEFVAPDGKISFAEGESVISIHGTEITNESWVQLESIKRSNHYKITRVSPSELIFESFNPELGKQTGIFNIDRNTVFSKFKIEETSLNGFEIIRREADTCYTQGALYDNDSLVNTWSAVMNKESDTL
ncbi:MAG: hypothetical protein LBQ60_20100 [Bacteroidales bacterium]|nr:hypothetical protein [Bacteroidales bacterium]